MAVSISAGFVDAFLKSFTRTGRELLLHVFVLLGNVLFWFLQGKAKDHLGEIAVPVVWVLCCEVAWHSVKAAYLLNEEIGPSTDRGPSRIVSQYGEPFELPIAKRRPYRIKIFSIAAVAVAICLSVAVLVPKIARPVAIVPPTPASGSPKTVTVLTTCNPVFPPVSIPPATTYYIVRTDPHIDFGVDEVSSDAKSSRWWPSKPPPRESQPPPRESYGCVFNNYDNQALLAVSVVIHLTFYSVQKEIKVAKKKTTKSLTVLLQGELPAPSTRPNAHIERIAYSEFWKGTTTSLTPNQIVSEQDRRATIPVIRANDSATLYLLNEGPYFVLLDIPTGGKTVVTDYPEPQPIVLVRPETNILQKLPEWMLPPARTESRKPSPK